jgi:hypothetical protein
MYAGDEHEWPIYDGPEGDEGDPLDYPCQECGADPGEQCRPYCTAAPGA